MNLVGMGSSKEGGERYVFYVIFSVDYVPHFILLSSVILHAF